MPTLPAASSFTGSTVTEAQFKAAITDQREFLAGLLGTAGTQAAALTTLGAALNGTLAKTAAYTVVTADRGKLIDATTGTWTLTLTAAATLGNGFAFAIRNSGTGVITIDPNSAEQIDGASTIPLAAGESCLIICDGAGWKTVGKTVATTVVNISTPQNASGNTAVSFASIPTGAKKVTLTFSGLSTNGANTYALKIGPSAGVESAGYSGSTHCSSTGALWSSYIALTAAAPAAADTYTGQVVLNLLNPTTNLWVINGDCFKTSAFAAASNSFISGSKSLSGALSVLEVSAGGNAFDAGSINISYEM